MIIYKSTNKVNHKCYIGQTVSTLHKRMISHKSSSKINSYKSVFHSSIRKHGWDNFTWEVLCECQSKEEMDEMEFHYIKQYRSIITDSGYNMTWGGEGTPGKKDSDITRKKKSISRLGSLNPMCGKKRTEDEKKLMSINSMGIGTGEDNGTVKLAGTYLITYPDGHQEEIKNLRGFCREYNLDRGSMYSICNGKKTSKYKGWWVKRLTHSHQKLCEMGKSKSRNHYTKIPAVSNGLIL